MLCHGSTLQDSLINCTVPNKPVPNKPVPNKPVPNKPAANKVVPKRTTPGKSVLNKSAASKALSKKTTPNKPTSDKSVSNKPASNKPAPKQSLPKEETLTTRGLERRLKRHLLKETQEYFAVCAVGFEGGLEQELLPLSPLLTIISKEPGGVTFTAPLETLYHTNLHSRTAHRILLRIDDFLAQSYPMLFNKVSKLPWELYLGFNKTYSIQVSAKESRLHQHKTIAKTIHDGITDYLKPLGLSPRLTDDAPLEIHARFFQDRCTLSVNTSGEHLHKRGYRQLVSEAPIRETLAASILQSVNVQNFETIVDPMCGSGTFLIEAAMILENTPLGLQRSFAFEQLPFFQASKWERFKREALAKQTETSVKLLGFDIDPKNIEIARANAVKAGVADLIIFEVADAKILQVSATGKLLMICNVPYGERLESTVLTPFAKNLQKNFKGWHFAFVTKEMKWLESFNLQTTKRFQNGGLNVNLVTGDI
jgi:putative N6-adenine-specific DNA methylase